MSSVNKVILVGRAGQDPEVKTVGDSKTVAKFSIAVDEFGPRGDDGKPTKTTQWFNISCWDNLANTVSQYLKKGTMVYLEGRIKIRNYEVDGVKKMAVEIIAERLQFLGGKSTEDSAESKPAASKPAASKPAASKPAAKPASAPVAEEIPGYGTTDSEDLPF